MALAEATHADTLLRERTAQQEREASHAQAIASLQTSVMSAARRELHWTQEAARLEAALAAASALAASNAATAAAASATLSQSEAQLAAARTAVVAAEALATEAKLRCTAAEGRLVAVAQAEAVATATIAILTSQTAQLRSDLQAVTTQLQEAHRQRLQRDDHPATAASANLPPVISRSAAAAAADAIGDATVAMAAASTALSHPPIVDASSSAVDSGVDEEKTAPPPASSVLPATFVTSVGLVEALQKELAAAKADTLQQIQALESLVKTQVAGISTAFDVIKRTVDERAAVVVKQAQQHHQTRAAALTHHLTQLGTMSSYLGQALARATAAALAVTAATPTGGVGDSAVPSSATASSSAVSADTAAMALRIATLDMSSALVAVNQEIPALRTSVGLSMNFVADVARARSFIDSFGQLDVLLASAGQSTALGIGTMVARTNTPTVMTVCVKDQLDRPVPGLGLAVLSVEIDGVTAQGVTISEARLPGRDSVLSPITGGVYAVSYQLPSPGLHRVAIRMDGQHIKASPFQVSATTRLFGVGVGGAAYKGYRPLLLAELQDPTIHQDLISVYKHLNGTVVGRRNVCMFVVV